MGTIYRRGRSPFWYVGFLDARGRRAYVSTKSAEESYARELLEKLEARVEAQVRMGVIDGPVTVRMWCETWLRKRKRQGAKSHGQEEQRLKDHLPPWLGDMPIDDVRSRHALRLVEWWRENRDFSARTERHMAFLVRQVFEGAIRPEGLISSNPMAWHKGDLRKKQDRDPARRLRAKWSREEVELLISDRHIPADRRTLYAVLFLSGLRIGEAIELRWSDWEQRKPLRRILVSRSWDYTRGVEGPPKTGEAREVPEHPTLAKVLGEWRLSGWVEFMGRALTHGDLLFPRSSSGEHRTASGVWKRLKKDCELVGVTVRWTHATRHTFTSLLKDDGADPWVVEHFTHPHAGTMASTYTHLSWERMCLELSKLKIQLLGGRTLSLPASSYFTATSQIRETKT